MKWQHCLCLQRVQEVPLYSYCYLTVCRTSCAPASGPADRGSHSNWCSSSSRRWPPSCSWRTTVSSWSRPPPAASPPPSVSSPRPPAVPAPAPDSASSQPSSALQRENHEKKISVLIRQFLNILKLSCHRQQYRNKDEIPDKQSQCFLCGHQTSAAF